MEDLKCTGHKQPIDLRNGTKLHYPMFYTKNDVFCDECYRLLDAYIQKLPELITT